MQKTQTVLERKNRENENEYQKNTRALLLSSFRFCTRAQKLNKYPAGAAENEFACIQIHNKVSVLNGTAKTTEKRAQISVCRIYCLYNRRPDKFHFMHRYPHIYKRRSKRFLHGLVLTVVVFSGYSNLVFCLHIRTPQPVDTVFSVRCETAFSLAM